MKYIFETRMEVRDYECDIEGIVNNANYLLCWSNHKEIPHVQSKRNPSKTVGVVRGHQRTDILKP